MKLIYLAHPFGGKQENVDKVEKIIKNLINESPDCTFYSPLHATGFYYNDVGYLDGLDHCFEVLRRCNALWLCEGWQDSRGCNMEYAYAKGKGIPVEFITG